MAYLLGRRCRRLLFRVGNIRKTNKSGVESWSDEAPGRGEQTMKISRVHGIWILKAKGVCLYFPSLEELIRKARMLLESL